MGNKTDPSHIVNFTNQIDAFEICGNDFACNLFCVTISNTIILGLLRFPEESETETFGWERLKELYNDARSHKIAFAPKTSLALMPKVITLCTTGSDFIVRIFRTELDTNANDTVQVLKGHTNYVNDVAWEHDEEFLASVSDDHSCKIWSSQHNFETTTTFCLSSAGMSVRWHPDEPGKVLVAEKKGIIHLYNVRSQQAIMSLESPKFPLMSADWCLHNRLFVTALAGGDVITWDLRRTCGPTDVKQIHEDGGRVVQFSPNSEVLYASIGRPDITLKVYTVKSTVPLIESSLKLFGGMSWHHRLPYVGAACDRKLCFWKVQIK